MTVTINGSTGIDKVQDGIVTDTKLNLTANSAEIKEALNASNGAPIYACRAWVNFNGAGTVAIRASGNVSSITDNGTGDYTVNFTNAMPDASYSVQGSTVGNTVDVWSMAFPTQTSSSFQIIMKFLSSGSSTIFTDDRTVVSASLFR